MKTFKILVLLLITVTTVYSREIRLEDCQAAAQNASSLKKQQMIQESKYIFDERSLTSNYLPQISIDGQATYQSEVVKLVLPFPNIKLPEIPLQQYKVNLNVTQLIWDGGATSSSKDVKLYESRVNQKATDVNLYNIKDIINQIYFNILLTQENIKTLEVTAAQLDTNMKIIESLVRNGVLLRSNLESINIEQLKISQNIEQAKVSKLSLINMLSKWTETEIKESDSFMLPGIQSIDYSAQKRSEYELFNERAKLTEMSADLAKTQLMPKILAFGTGGYGNPNPLNFFDTEGSFYYIVGLKFQWTPFDWNSNHNKVQSIMLNKEIIETERDNFKKTLDINIVKEETELQKYDKLLEMDTEIIDRQQRIIDEYFSRLKNNTITINDYLAQVNSMLASRINRDIHKIQQLRSKVNLLTITGNY